MNKFLVVLLAGVIINVNALTVYSNCDESDVICKTVYGESGIVTQVYCLPNESGVVVCKD